MKSYGGGYGGNPGLNRELSIRRVCSMKGCKSVAYKSRESVWGVWIWPSVARLSEAGIGRLSGGAA